MTRERWLASLAVQTIEQLNPNVAAYATWWRAQGFSAVSWRDRVRTLARVNLLVGPLDDLTTEQITGWLASPRWSAKTRTTYHQHLRGYYRFKYEVGRADADPMARLRQPKVPAKPPKQPARAELAEVVLAQAPEPWRTAVLLAYYQGFRCLEIAAVRREDVTAESITVRGKGGHIEQVPTHPKVWEHVRGRGPGPLVLLDGEPLTAEQVSGRWIALAAQRGWGVTMHQWRHGYCNRLRLAGVDVRVIQTLMRHRSIETTMRYMHVDEDERRAAMALI